MKQTQRKVNTNMLYLTNYVIYCHSNFELVYSFVIDKLKQLNPEFSVLVKDRVNAVYVHLYILKTY